MRRPTVGRLIAGLFAATIISLLFIDTTQACRWFFHHRAYAPCRHVTAYAAPAHVVRCAPICGTPCPPVQRCEPVHVAPSADCCGDFVGETWHGASEDAGEAGDDDAGERAADEESVMESASQENSEGESDADPLVGDDAGAASELPEPDESTPPPPVPTDVESAEPADDGAEDSPADASASDAQDGFDDLPPDDLNLDELPADDAPADAATDAAEADDALPGFDDLPADSPADTGDANLPLDDAPADTDDALPGFDEVPAEADDALPGFDDAPADTDETLPGFDDAPADGAPEEDVLPGFDEPLEDAPADDAAPVDDGDDDSLDDLFSRRSLDSNRPAVDDSQQIYDSQPVSQNESASETKMPAQQVELTERLWTDNTGRYTTVGRLVKIGTTHVRLLKSNGRFTTVPKRRLSQADLDYVHRMTARLGVEDIEKLARR